MLVMETQPLALVKANLSRFIDAVEGTHERVTITRNGKRAAVLISADDLDGLLETLDILRNADTVANLRQGETDITRGDSTGLADAKALQQEIRNRTPRQPASS